MNVNLGTLLMNSCVVVAGIRRLTAEDHQQEWENIFGKHSRVFGGKCLGPGPWFGELVLV